MMRIYGHLPAAFALLMTITLTGCGGGGSNTEPVTLPAGSIAVTSALVAPGAVCPNGGISVESGIDENRNGILDAEEVDATQYVCNGEDGSNGLSTLVLISDEAAGANCTSGGKKVEAGLDADANAILDVSEVSSTAYVCDGTVGATGSNSLVAIVPEPPGAYCTYGGNKISSGIDANSNNVLDADEVSASNYICDGAPGPGIVWQDVTGTSVQAASNTGYLANNATEPVLITLPATPVYGDIVQVTGVGAGGWRVLQNAGQSIITANVMGNIGATWSSRDTPRNWSSVASSSDGNRLVASVYNGDLYISTDAGLSWTASGGVSKPWKTVTSSAGGNYLAAGVENNGLYLSNDSGLTWSATLYDNWTSLASSADGSKIVAASTFYLYTLTNFGLSSQRGPAGNWASVASSADGNLLVAVDSDIHISTDSGIHWDYAYVGGHDNWSAVASSADGSKLIAAVFGGQIYTITLDPTLPIGPANMPVGTARDQARNWIAVASSSDGRRLLAAEQGGQLYTSVDSGITWVPRDSARNWKSVASSADGAKLVAVDQGGLIYTSSPSVVPSTTAGTTGFISGSQYDTVDLQYIGNGTFLVRGYIGYLSVQ